MRTWKKYHCQNIEELRTRVLHYAGSFDVFTFLDSCNNNVYGKNTFDFMCAAGSYKSLRCNTGDAYRQLSAFLHENLDWCFGYFAYDLKNETEKLSSQNSDFLQLPDLYFFIPQVLIICEGDEMRTGTIEGDENVFDKIMQADNQEESNLQNAVTLRSRFSREEYAGTVNTLKNHILEGDLYEVNFCQEFYAENTPINVNRVFRNLCRQSRAPFSSCFRLHDVYLISASPERFMKKEKNTIFSQPMKGTSKRSALRTEDEVLKQKLFMSEKDRSENVMIVDLVRNDFAKSARTGTIRVEELFGIYTFEHVHQMVSTVVAELRNDVNPVQAIQNTFPMGSMTGAPKVMAMQLIEKYEKTKRGLFSGAFGYFDEKRDFDFNVVIRSILYNAAIKYVSVQVGSAIVYDSDAENEYEECLVKLQGLVNALNS